jgi:serine/threonine protein kinase
MDEQDETCSRSTAMPTTNREEELFAAVLEKPTPAERAAFLDGACGNDLALRGRIEALLASHDAGGILDAPPLHPPATTAYRPLTEGPGTIIGPYKLLQQIGEGGMGVVYMAEQQEPVRRKVALKIIKPGMDSQQVIARFEAERQALAMMDHQNIARVLDAGTTGEARGEGREASEDPAVLSRPSPLTPRPYFVMELVHGVPITKFCDDNQLTPRERLALFVPVCQAIQHAHQKGIIHRDIKPSNVLVTMYDDKPVPKVIDFGVAKAIEQRLTEKTLFTQFGAFVGTFEYMSPEQAEMNAFGVDTRSDVYSLGVLLYELLTGTTPLERQRLRQAALDEVIRLIREEEPPRPSVRLSSAGDLPKIAAARHTAPGRLATLLRGELDWIVMRCLEKDRTRRYESASALASDAERYLHDEPVEACPPSAAYRLRKFARKYRGPLLAASFVFLALVGGMIGTLVGWRQAIQSVGRERDARVEAQEARDDAEGALARGLISPLDPNGGEVLNLAECEVLWQLARLDNERVRRRYLEVGLRDEVLRGQLEHRSERAAHAVVGLDLQRREQALAEVMQAMAETGRSGFEQFQIAWVGLELALPGSAQERELAAVAGKQLLAEENDAQKKSRLGRLVELSSRLEARAAGQLLISALNTPKQAYLATALAAVAERLPPAEAAQLLETALEKDGYAPDRGRLAEAMASVAARLTPEEASQICAPAAQILATGLEKASENRSGPPAYDRWCLTAGLTAVAARLTPVEANRICAKAAQGLVTALSSALEKETDGDARRSPALALALVTANLTPVEANQICAPAAEMLAKALENERDAGARWSLASVLAAVAEHLTPAEANQTCAPAVRILAGALEKESDSGASQSLAWGLAAVVDRLTPVEANQICAPAAQRLVAALEKESGARGRESLAYGLAAVAERVTPAEANRFCARAAQSLAKTLENERDPGARRSLASGLAAVAGRLTPAEANRICAPAAQILAKDLENGTDYFARQSLIDVLARVADRLTPVEAARVLFKSLQKDDNPFALGGSPRLALAAVVARLTPEQATQICAPAAQTLATALGKNNNDNAGWSLLLGLEALSPRLTPAEAARIAQILTTALESAPSTGLPSGGSNRELLARALVAVAARLTPTAGAELLATTLEKESDSRALQSLAEGLAAVAGRLTRAQANLICAKAARLLINALTGTVEDPWDRRRLLARGLAAVAARFESGEQESILVSTFGIGWARNPQEAEDLVRLLHALDISAENEASWNLAQSLVNLPTINQSDQHGNRAHVDSVNALCLVATDVRSRASALAASVGLTPANPSMGWATLPAASEPLGCRFSTQQLVDLLKMPTCVGQVRRVLLDRLGDRYHQRFASHWEFVLYAQEHGLNLDFTSPPRRPPAKLPPLKFQPGERDAR